jgi:hypothetical protein
MRSLGGVNQITTSCHLDTFVDNPSLHGGLIGKKANSIDDFSAYVPSTQLLEKKWQLIDGVQYWLIMIGRSGP